MLHLCHLNTSHMKAIILFGSVLCLFHQLNISPIFVMCCNELSIRSSPLRSCADGQPQGPERPPAFQTQEPPGAFPSLAARQPYQRAGQGARGLEPVHVGPGLLSGKTHGINTKVRRMKPLNPFFFLSTANIRPAGEKRGATKKSFSLIKICVPPFTVSFINWKRFFPR